MTDIERWEPRASSALDTIHLAPKAWKLSEAVANTELVPRAIRGKPESVLAIILAGAEAGIAPMTALAKIHVIEGRIAVSAELMRAQVLAAGHDLWVDELTTTRCKMSGQRRGSPRTSSVEWTIDDARAAGLLGKDPWKKYPRNMLEARATSELCRLLFPDVLAGLSYTPDELEEQGTIGLTPDGEPAPRARAPRQRAKAAHTATDAPAISAPEPELEPPAPTEPAPEIVDADVVEPEPAEPELEPELVPEPAPVAEPADEIADADWYQPSPEPELEPEPERGRLTGPQAIAVRFGELGVTDRTLRLEIVSTLVSRTVESGNDLTPAEVRTVLDTDPAYVTELAARLRPPEPSTVPPPVDPDPTTGEPEAGPSPRSAVLGARAGSGPSSSSSSTTSSDPEQWTADEWRALIASRKLKVSAVMREATRLAAEAGKRVGTLDAVAGSGIAADLLGYVEDESLR